MKNLFFAFISLLLMSCSHTDSPQLEIITASDTVGIDELFRAEFHLTNYDYSEIWPDHYVVRPGVDTMLFMWDEEEGYGVYNASSSQPGKKEYQGFVIYEHNDHKDTIFFKREFYVVE